MWFQNTFSQTTIRHPLAQPFFVYAKHGSILRTIARVLWKNSACLVEKVRVSYGTVRVSLCGGRGISHQTSVGWKMLLPAATNQHWWCVLVCSCCSNVEPRRLRFRTHTNKKACVLQHLLWENSFFCGRLGAPRVVCGRLSQANHSRYSQRPPQTTCVRGV